MNRMGVPCVSFMTVATDGRSTYPGHVKCFRYGRRSTCIIENPCMPCRDICHRSYDITSINLEI